MINGIQNMEWWGTLLISIGSAVVGGIITGLFTVYNEKRKLDRVEKQRKKDELQKQYELRPRLELKNFKSIEEGDVNSKADFEVLLLNFKNLKPVGHSFFFNYDKKSIRFIKLMLC